MPVLETYIQRKTKPREPPVMRFVTARLQWNENEVSMYHKHKDQSSL